MDSADFQIKETIILEHTVDRKEKAGTPGRIRTYDLLTASQARSLKALRQAKRRETSLHKRTATS